MDETTLTKLYENYSGKVWLSFDGKNYRLKHDGQTFIHVFDKKALKEFVKRVNDELHHS